MEALMAFKKSMSLESRQRADDAEAIAIKVIIRYVIKLCT